jgi:hypothetical protein
MNKTPNPEYLCIECLQIYNVASAPLNIMQTHLTCSLGKKHIVSKEAT